MAVLEEVLNFWFHEAGPNMWWKKDESFDQEISTRFGELHQRACACELFAWRQSAKGRLAEVIILDQFSRNIHRDTPHAFASDPLALALAQEAVALNIDKTLSQEEKSFFYMPYMHSESLLIHEHAVKLFSAAGLSSNVDFELKHKKIIDRFGRYPHRNAIMGRTSTPEELAFLQEPGSSF